MKNLLWIALVMLSMVACQKQQKENDLQALDLKGKVKYLSEITYNAIERNKTIGKGDIEWYSEYLFNEQGNTTVYKDDESRDVHRYDDKGNKIKSMIYDIDGGLVSQLIYEYDEKGNSVGTIATDSEGRLIWRESYPYSGDGTKYGEILYRSDESLEHNIIYDYGQRKLDRGEQI